jgi:hypothetical protein
MPNIQLSFTMQTQKQTQWCWAAVSVSTALFYSPSSIWKQCDVVDAELNQSNCCMNGSSPSCNKPWYLDTALARVGHLSHSVARPASFADCDQELTGGRPLGAHIAWSPFTGHFVVVSGIGNNANQLVTIQDPANGLTTIPYGTFVSAYLGTGTWDESFFTQ